MYYIYPTPHEQYNLVFHDVAITNPHNVKYNFYFNPPRQFQSDKVTEIQEWNFKISVWFHITLATLFCLVQVISRWFSISNVSFFLSMFHFSNLQQNT